MDHVELIKQLVIYFDKIDKLLAFLAFVLLVAGADFKLELKNISINFDRRQIIYFRTAGICLLLLSMLPSLLAILFKPVDLKDLVELKAIIDNTQGMTDRGLNGSSEGEHCFYATKEMPYAHGSNLAAQTKINSMIKALRP
ncbi:hypothetical protein [Methylobacterium sp. Leaf361]|uniref:hypothetical protein n=1 Tax=Methylobacterium sp. Leaf361 TaxID=1736352 RepID=UPI000AF14BCC|nr:hypothetical protein [Methylobacterium sp. Leaf361]